MRNHEPARMYSVANTAKGLSPTADHVLRLIEQLSSANARFRLDNDTLDLLAAHSGLSYREMAAVIESIEESGALRYLGIDARGCAR